MARRLAAVVSVVVLFGVCSPAWGQDAKPSLEFVAPGADQTLAGSVEVRVKAKPPNVVPSHMFVTLGGPPFARMARVGETDEWAGQLNTALYPNGQSPLIVLAAMPGAKRVQQTLTVRVENPLKCYFGDIHSHTYNSDGMLLPADAHAYARDVAKLDFFVLTDHLEAVDELEWADMREQAWKANEDGVFVAFPGLEWTKGAGHANLLDPPTRLWPADVAGMYQAVRTAGIIGMFNHPGDGSKVFDALAYSEIGDQAMQLMEVRQDTEQAAFIRALNAGWHIAPAGTDDTHSNNWGNAGRWTGIVAPGLSRRNVWDALKARHCYSTLDRNCRLFFRVNGALMGEVIAQPSPNAQVLIDITDPDEGDAIAKIELYQDGVVTRADEPTNGPTRVRASYTFEPEPGGHYYFVKVTQADGQKLWSAPVWLTVPAR
ncbi:MAG: CehA/McbA family metallohydrolase [Armatimonadota bacterium]